MYCKQLKIVTNKEDGGISHHLSEEECFLRRGGEASQPEDTTKNEVPKCSLQKLNMKYWRMALLSRQS